MNSKLLKRLNSASDKLYDNGHIKECDAIRALIIEVKSLNHNIDLLKVENNKLKQDKQELPENKNYMSVITG